MGKSCLLLRFAVSAPFPKLVFSSDFHWSILAEACLVLQDDTYTESYISTIGVDFVRSLSSFT